jgi:hypothetical protein
LVAQELEERWNQALARVRELERQIEQQAGQLRRVSTRLNEEELLDLADRLEEVWHDGRADSRLKKRIAEDDGGSKGASEARGKAMTAVDGRLAALIFLAARTPTGHSVLGVILRASVRLTRRVFEHRLCRESQEVDRGGSLLPGTRSLLVGMLNAPQPWTS